MSNSIYHGGLKTQNTTLAAALTAVGVPLDPVKPFETFIDNGREVLVYYFQPASEDGKMITTKLIEAWSDREWHKHNPEHPFAYIKCAFENRNRLVDLVKKRSPIALVRKGKKTAFLSLDADSSLQDIILCELERKS